MPSAEDNRGAGSGSTEDPAQLTQVNLLSDTDDMESETDHESENDIDKEGLEPATRLARWKHALKHSEVSRTQDPPRSLQAPL
jgi:hypothetical protein